MRSGASERGQVLVIFAGGLILLLAIAALVIDIGFTLTIRRQEQNAADPGAIAAARYIQPTVNVTAMRQAACFYARMDGYFGSATNNDQCDAAHDAFGTSLGVNYPPSSAAGTYAGRAGFVEVVLTRLHRSFLAQLVGQPTIEVSASAVAAYTNGNSNSNSLVALDPRGCIGQAAGVVSGGGTVQINPAIDPSTGLPYDGGYVHVNSTCGIPPGSPNGICDVSGSSALSIDGSGSSLTAPHVFTSGTCVRSTSNSFNSPLDEGVNQIGDPLSGLPPPSFAPPGAYCGDSSAPQTDEITSSGCKFHTNNTTYNLQPGVYYGGWKVTGQNVTLSLAPGIYVMAGGGISVGSTGTITSVVGGSGPAPVMIFSTDNPRYTATCRTTYTTGECIDAINFTAGSDLLLQGLTSGPYKGILIWQDGSVSGDTDGPKLAVTLSGQGSLNLSGTIYDPRGTVTLDGGSSGTGFAAVQIIAWRWVITGSASLVMPYDPKQLYQFEQLGLVK